jgi:hypothetical protein
MTKKEPANHANRREKIPEKKVRVNSRHSRANSLFPYSCPFVVKGTKRKGRLGQPAAELAQAYGESVSLDRRLYRHDISGSIAHAVAPARAGSNRRRGNEKVFPAL